MSEEAKQSLIDVIKGWPLKRKLSLAAVAAVTPAPFAGIILQAQGADYRLLYANLSDGDAASVINWLKEQKIPYQLANDGKAIKVPGDKVYEGMIVGIHSRDNDLVVNPIKTKKLTNVRAAGKDENVLLTPPVKLTLELAVEFIDDDELVEVTPKSIRIRKRYLTEHERRRAVRDAAASAVL